MDGSVANIPPSASGVVLVDFDGTITAWGGLFELGEPFPGVVKALQSLAKDYRIVIFTSRLSRQWWEADYRNFGYRSPEDFGAANLEYIVKYLHQYEIPYSNITAEKVPAVAYFDDKAYRAAYGDLPKAIREFGDEAA